MAVPTFDPASVIPKNGTYIYGKDSDLFAVAIEGSLDTSTVKLHARVEDPTSIWRNITMNCFLISSSRWNCTGYVMGLEALVKDGDWLLFYFDAFDMEDNYGTLGNSSDPLRVRIDRSPPEIDFISPRNQSYSSGEVEIRLQVWDKYSGVDPTSVKYSFDNSTWLDMRGEDERIFISLEKWNTRSYPNNESVYIYGKASDIFGNTAYTRIITFVDNELPSFNVSEPKENQLIYGSYVFKIEASDKYSGLNFTIYRVGNFFGYFYCSNAYQANCSASFNSIVVNDGKYDVVIEVYDNAGNKVNASIPITIDNLPPNIRIISPTQATTVSGNFNISAEVIDDGIGTSKVKFRIESDGSAGEWKDMKCGGNICSTIWNSSEVIDGNYVIRIYAEDLLGRNSSLTSYISVVNAVNIPQTTTTFLQSTTKEEESKPSNNIFKWIKNSKLFSNIIDRIKKKPILAIAFFLPLFSLPIVFLLSTRKPREKEGTNIEKKFEECFMGLEDIRNIINNSLEISDINQMKDRVRMILISLEKMEKEPLKKTIDLISLTDERFKEELKFFLEGKEGEIKIIQTQKEEYLQEIYKLLKDCLSEESLENIRGNLETVNTLIRKFRGLIEREVSILSEALSEIEYK
ncbi:MAG: Ig-like domain-containing protein [Candidatus Aenigmatarchaeota archaeon]